MNKPAVIRNWLLCTAIALMTLPTATYAEDCPADIKAVTATDVKVPIQVLSYRVKPLTKCELQAEAEAWLVLLKEKVTEISDAEVAAIYRKKEQQKKTDAEDTPPQDAAVKQAIEVVESKALHPDPADAETQAATQDTAEIKTALVKHATRLTAERTALIDRFNVVLDAWKIKGGETEEYTRYIKAVSGIKVDVTDASATWTTISGWLLSPEGGFRWAVNIIQFVVIVLVFYLLSIVAGKAAQKAASRSKTFSALLRDFLVISARRLVLFIGFFVGLSALEINVGPVLAVIGAAGFVIAFALQNSLSNFASGILMLIYRPFDTGDTIKVASILGKVESMNLLSTQLRTPDNQLVIVPNNSVWGDVITNVTGITQRRVDLIFGISYDDDIDKAQTILEDIVNGHELVLKEPAAVVKLHELGDSSVNFVCRPWAKPEHYWDVYWDITRAVKRRFDAEGVSIPFPQRDVHIYQESLSNA